MSWTPIDLTGRRRFIVAFGILIISSLCLLPAFNAAMQGDVRGCLGMADDLLAGKLPYRDHVFEYPPYVIPIFLLPKLFGRGEDNYLEGFKTLALTADWVVRLSLLAIGLRHSKTARALLPLLLYSAAVPLRIFKCPGDNSSHVRTYSMSQAVGTKPGVGAAVNGPWLDGTRHHVANHPWHTYGRLSSMVNPAPSGLWVFMDENRYNINDAAFAVSMTTPTEVIDWPGTYHNSSCGLAFADGHSEIHRWLDGRTKIRARVASGPHVQLPNNPDILWLQARTSARTP